jgi:hypothetical protein
MCKEMGEDGARNREGSEGMKLTIARLETERNEMSARVQELLRAAEGRGGGDAGAERKLERSRARARESHKVVRALAGRLEKAQAMLRAYEAVGGVGGGAGGGGREGGGEGGGGADPHSVMLVKTLSMQVASERSACRSALVQVDKARVEYEGREALLLDRIAELEGLLHYGKGVKS